MSTISMNSKEHFVSNVSRARHGLNELKTMEESFAKHLGKIEGVRGPKTMRSISVSESDLEKLKAGGRQEFGPIVFSSSYRLESDHTMVGVESEDGKSFTRSGIGDQLPPDSIEQRNQLRWSTREALVKGIRAIATDVASIQSVDILEWKCVGTEFMRMPVVKQNNILHLRHTILLEHAMYGDQAALLLLLKKDARPKIESLEMPSWTLNPELNFDAFASAVKFIAFDEITLMFQRMNWERSVGKTDPNVPQILLFRKDWPVLKHKELRLERLKKMIELPITLCQ